MNKIVEYALVAGKYALLAGDAAIAIIEMEKDSTYAAAVNRHRQYIGRSGLPPEIAEHISAGNERHLISSNKRRADFEEWKHYMVSNGSPLI